MVRRVALVGTDVSDEIRASIIRFIDPCLLEDGGAKFLRNVGSYKSHRA
jgi:hypothetical protein